MNSTSRSCSAVCLQPVVVPPQLDVLPVQPGVCVRLGAQRLNAARGCSLEQRQELEREQEGARWFTVHCVSNPSAVRSTST